MGKKEELLWTTWEHIEVQSKGKNGPFAEYDHMGQKHVAGLQTRQRGMKNKQITSFEKLISFLSFFLTALLGFTTI